MLGRAIWDKLTGCVFESFEISRIKRGQFQSFQIAEPTCDYWLITRKQQTLCIETNIF